MLSLSLRIELFFIVFMVIKVYSNELTFELPDNAKECFNDKLKVGSKYVLEFQVINFQSINEFDFMLFFFIGCYRWKL